MKQTSYFMFNVKDIRYGRGEGVGVVILELFIQTHSGYMLDNFICFSIRNDIELNIDKHSVCMEPNNRF